MCRHLAWPGRPGTLAEPVLEPPSAPCTDGRRRDVPDRHFVDVGPDGVSPTPLEESA
jgi:hypothetical protein